VLQQYDPGLNIDFYTLGLNFLGVSTTVGAINFIVTFFKLRAPGMSVNRVPILMWGTLTTSISILFAMPALTVACVMLYFERRFGMHFFDPSGGGHPLLWQHLFWIFGHPWVYIVVLPAMGIVSDMVPTFARRPLVGYTFVALATISTGILGFGVWVHHMFATGLPQMAMTFFSAASMTIVIPSAVAIFAWIATIWLGRPVMNTPFLFLAGFIVLFVIGGVSGVVTAAIPFDWQVTDTYFVVAHLHYVLVGINLFAVMAGLYYWFPKMTGRLLNDRLGRWNFWVMFIGMNLAFFPMHIVGLLGMPRRVFTYPAGFGWSTLNLLETIGAYIFAVGILLFLINVVRSLRHGEPAGPNPWGAGTLEWSTPSPPPAYNFAVIPTVGSRHPLWEGTLVESAGSQIDGGPALEEDHQTLATTPLEAEADLVLHMPGDSLWPLLLSLAMTILFYGALLTSWTLAIVGGVGLVITIGGWFWPVQPWGEPA
jgi:heme/copper-type cytochrome/quinol oxidase subunit 1